MNDNESRIDKIEIISNDLSVKKETKQEQKKKT